MSPDGAGYFISILLKRDMVDYSNSTLNIASYFVGYRIAIVELALAVNCKNNHKEDLTQKKSTDMPFC